MKTHDLDIPRIGYIHSWTRTQDEGWCAPRSTLRRAVHLLRRSEAARRQPAREVRRDHLPARRRHARVSQVNGMPKTGSAPLPYKKTADDAEPRLRRSERRHPRRHGHRRAGRAREVRAGGRHADHRRIDGDDLPGVRDHDRRHGRGAGAAVRARLDPARQDHRHEEPDRLRLRRAPICRSTSTRRRC